MASTSDEPVFGSTPATREFAKFSRFSPLREILPGEWSRLMGRASLVQTVDELPKSDQRLLLEAKKEAAKEK